MISVRQLDPSTQDAVRRFMALAQSPFSPRAVIVFGSRALGTHRADSDADVALLLAGAPASFVATKLAMSDLAFDVLLETGINISPLPVWIEQWEHPGQYHTPALLHNIARDGIWV